MLRRCPWIDPTPPYEAGRRSSKVARTFAAISIDGRTTELTVREYGYPDKQIVEISRAGMERCLDKMATSLAPG